MNEKCSPLPRTGAMYLPAADIDKLLALGNGDSALLYLHILRRDGQYLATAAARELGLSLSRIETAAELLRRSGLLLPAMEAPLAPPDELPEYTGDDISRRSEEDPVFKALQMECRQVLGHNLSGADLKTLFGIYDHLGLSAPVIMLLLHFCSERMRRRYGEGRLPTMRAIEKEAFAWAHREIVTEEQAEEYIAARERRDTETGKLARELGITGRSPTKTEAEYMEKWLDMGYTAETLAIAHDRTVTGAGWPAWRYMDKIVGSWYNKKLFTAKEIEEGDPRNGKSAVKGKPNAPAVEPITDDFERLMDQYVRKK